MAEPSHTPAWPLPKPFQPQHPLLKLLASRASLRSACPGTPSRAGVRFFLRGGWGASVPTWKSVPGGRSPQSCMDGARVHVHTPGMSISKASEPLLPVCPQTCCHLSGGHHHCHGQVASLYHDGGHEEESGAEARLQRAQLPRPWGTHHVHPLFQERQQEITCHSDACIMLTGLVHCVSKDTTCGAAAQPARGFPGQSVGSVTTLWSAGMRRSTNGYHLHPEGPRVATPTLFPLAQSGSFPLRCR